MKQWKLYKLEGNKPEILKIWVLFSLLAEAASFPNDILTAHTGKAEGSGGSRQSPHPLGHLLQVVFPDSKFENHCPQVRATKSLSTGILKIQFHAITNNWNGRRTNNALQMFIHLDSYQFRMGLTPTYFGINLLQQPGVV